jgi:hypothetical protein
MHIDDTEDILAALDKAHARLAQSVSGAPPAAADEPATWEDLLAREPAGDASLTLGTSSSTDPNFPSALGAPAPAAGRGEEGLVGTKQYNSADLLAAFETASAGGSAAQQQVAATAPQAAATAPQAAATATPQERQRAALLCEEAANHRSAAATLRQAARQQQQMVAVLGDEAAQREGLLEGAASQEQG